VDDDEVFQMNGAVYLKGVVTFSLDREKCTGCGMCVNVCPHGVFAMEEKKAVIRNLDACMECGACAKNCAFGAIRVKSGVGCARAVLNSLVKGTEPNCDCGSC
jgi:ferredoxin